jgi:CubicO group peptidase (beta-lactamase class C family)
MLRHFADSTRAPAISVAIARGGRIVYANAVGWRNLEDSVRADTATLFRIASVTKPLTATVIMRLVEAGRLNLDAPITDYCRAYPEKPWPVTSRQLLSHIAGVRDYAPVERGVWYTITDRGRVEGSNPFHYHALGDVVRIFAADSLAFEPGTRFAYSNVGFLLLGCVIEGVTQKPYPDALRELVLSAADMRRTQPADVWTIVPNRAQNYQVRFQQNAMFYWWTRAQKAELTIDTIYNARFEDTSIKLSAGGLMSTAPDLARFGAAILADRLLKPDTRELMWTEQRTRAGESTGWALGWSPGTDDGRRTVGLNGGQAGVSAQLRVFRDDGVSVAAIANRDLIDLRPLVSRLAKLWL